MEQARVLRGDDIGVREGADEGRRGVRGVPDGGAREHKTSLTVGEFRSAHADETNASGPGRLRARVGPRTDAGSTHRTR
ncbi:hypothetical protein GCM10009785_15490 [Brooklawnia cerclae]